MLLVCAVNLRHNQGVTAFGAHCAVVLLALCACSDAPTKRQRPANVQVTLAAFRVTLVRDGEPGPVITMDATGSVDVVGQDGVLRAGSMTLAANGTLVAPPTGVILALADDGTLAAPGNNRRVTLAKNGDIAMGDAPMMDFGDDGTVTFVGETSEHALYEGPAEARRAAAIVILGATIPKPVHPGVPK